MCWLAIARTPLPTTAGSANGRAGCLVRRRCRRPRRWSSGPMHLWRQAHEDRLCVASGFQPEQCAAIIEKVELHIAAAADQLVLAFGRNPGLCHAAANDPRVYF